MDNSLKPLTMKETGEFMKSFQQKASAYSQKTVSQSSSTVFDRFWASMSWTYALATFVVLFLIGAYQFYGQKSPLPSGEVPVFASLKGGVEVILPDGKLERVIADSEQAIAHDTDIKFAADSEPVEIKYKNGGKVFLKGNGQMKVLKDGLNVETGKFNARFKNLAGIMKVRVPCAVLAIRGTEIQFDIHKTRSEILLVEGAADLIPDNASQTTMRLETGKRVRLTESAWIYANPAPPVVPEVKPVDKPSEPVASESQSHISLPETNPESSEAQPLDGEVGNESENANDEETPDDGEPASYSNEAAGEEDESDFIGRESFFD
jgi:hypothetical protein